jgi:hypothetical protein
VRGVSITVDRLFSNISNDFCGRLRRSLRETA